MLLQRPTVRIGHLILPSRLGVFTFRTCISLIETDNQVIQAELPVHHNVGVVEVSVDAEALETLPGLVGKCGQVYLQHLTEAGWEVDLPPYHLMVDSRAIDHQLGVTQWH